MSNSASYSLGLTASAREKRNHQLRQWETSLTNREPEYIVTGRTGRVKFSQDVVFMAAVSSGDEEEVERLLSEDQANVNCTNADGLTALHQCCIDDNLEMFKVLVKHGANVNSCDNEGWTPLHAAASCGYIHIVKYLLEHNAFPASVNNEGQTPADLAEEHGSNEECQTPTDLTESYNKIVELLNSEIERLDLDMDEIRNEEEMLMLEDAKRLRMDQSLEPVVSKGGALPIHIAAAKEYTTVLNVLLSIPGLEVDPRDDDGWTPLHAAVYWASMETAELLILSGANIYLKTNNGETVDDLCDPEFDDELRRLKKLNSSINPEQAELLMRKTQNIIIRQKTPLVLQMSIDGQKGSPGLKRRLSKERLTVPKLDMAKEREDLMHSLERLGEEPQESSNGSISATTEPINTPNPPPSLQQQDSLQESPKSAKRMSTKMMAKVSMFEQGGGSSPSAPRTSTPVNSPQVNGPIDLSKKLVESSEMRPRVVSMDTTTKPKRFVFQSNPVSGSPSIERKDPSNLMRKTMSLDRHSTNALYREPIDIHPGRGVAASNGEPSTQPENTSVSKPISETKAHPAMISESPIASIPSSSQPLDISAMNSSDLSRNDSTSSASSTSSSALSRSSSVAKEPESRRKSEARKKRETRRPTQPVPTDLLDRIGKIDSIEERQFEGSQPPDHQPSPLVEQTSHPPVVKQAATDQPRDAAPSSPLTKPLSPTTSNEKIPSASPIKAIQIQTKMDEPNQTTYRRRSQAISKSVSVPIVTSPSPTEEQNKSDTVTSLRRASEPSQPGDGLLKVEDTSGLSPAIPRSKSTSATRRKPKEKRRSTGIPTEVEEGEEVPEVLKGIVKTKSVDTSAATNVEPSENLSPSAVQAMDESSVSTASLDYYNEEISRLKKLLAEQQAQCESAATRYQQVCAELKSKDQHIAELQRRCDDTKRAYAQEKLEREQKEKKIQQLEKSQKGVQELKAEIQRLRDENGALIRVVGKLSRAPLTT